MVDLLVQSTVESNGNPISMIRESESLMYRVHDAMHRDPVPGLAPNRLSGSDDLYRESATHSDSALVLYWFLWLSWLGYLPPDAQPSQSLQG